MMKMSDGKLAVSPIVVVKVLQFHGVSPVRCQTQSFEDLVTARAEMTVMDKHMKMQQQKLEQR